MISVNEDDFARLCAPSLRLRDMPPAQRAGLTGPDTGQAAPPARDWEWAYWPGPDYAAVILARSFLDSAAAAYQVMYDESPPQPGWVILTDYEVPGEAELADVP